MQHRLHHLESLVKDLMKAQTDGNGIPPSIASRSSNTTDASPNGSNKHTDSPISNVSPPEEIQHLSITADPPGQVLLGKTETNYVGATHWAAILDDVRAHK